MKAILRTSLVLSLYSVITPVLTAKPIPVQRPAVKKVAPSKAPAQPLTSSRKLVDTIVARVNGSNIMLSDLRTRHIAHNFEPYLAEHVLAFPNSEEFKKGLKLAIDDRLLFLKALERKLVPERIDIDKQIASIKVQKGISQTSEEDFDRVIREEAGISAREYRSQLTMVQSVNRLFSAELSERMVVTSSEARAYYEKNKETTEDVYTLKLASFSLSQVGASAQPSKGELLARPDVVWQELPAVSKSQLSEQFAQVAFMKEGDVLEPIRVGSGYQLVMLAKHDAAREKTFEEQYVAVEQALLEQKREHFERAFIEELRERATIVYFDF